MTSLAPVPLPFAMAVKVDDVTVVGMREKKMASRFVKMSAVELSRVTFDFFF